MAYETVHVDDLMRQLGKTPHRPQRSHGGRGHDGRKMTKIEARMAYELDLQHRAGQIKHWSYQAVKVRLADKTWYCPDFCIHWADGRIEFRETKGYWESDARTKFKVAAELHQWATFTAWRLVNGAWESEVAK